MQPQFTNDSVLTIAVAHSLMSGKPYVDSFHYFVRMNPKRGYGSTFGLWVQTGKKTPYNSFGNGSAMRVSPIAHYFNTEKDVLDEAKKSADVTHNHPEGVKGAQSVALAVSIARNGASKTDIKKEIIKRFGYDLNRTWAEIGLLYSFDVTCQGSVPEAIICFLALTDFEDAIRNAVALGGDADTQACIAGSIAEAFDGGVPSHHKEIAIKIIAGIKGYCA